MATDIKVRVVDGQFGLILHKHGNSAWHPASEVHRAALGKLSNDTSEDSHAVHKADEKAVFDKLASQADPKQAFEFKDNDGNTVKAENTAEYLAQEYRACLEGKPQLFWNINWKIKLANRKAKRLAREAAEAEETEEEEEEVLV